MSPSESERRIEVADRQRRYKADPERIARLLAGVLAAEKAAGRRLSVALVNDREIARVHVDFMGIEGPTDVISFPLDDEQDDLLGEVVVSTDTAALEAKERGLTLDREVLLYCVHGTLHLLGYDDHAAKDRKAMHARQEALLERFLSAEEALPGKPVGSRRTRAPGASAPAPRRKRGTARRGARPPRGRS